MSNSMVPNTTNTKISNWYGHVQLGPGKSRTDFYFWPRTQRRQPMNAESAIAERILTEIGSLPPDWDGYGALPMVASTVDNARGALFSLLLMVPLPDITPNPNGTISFEWETNRIIAALEIGATRFSFFLRPRAGRPAYAAGDAALISQHGIGQMIATYLFPFDRDWLATSGCRFDVPHVQAA